MSEKLIRDFLTLWVTIEPIGSLALFVSLTAKMPAQVRNRIALRAVAYSAAVLLGAIVLGQALLAALQISLTSLQIAGGIILFLFGLQMIFGKVAEVESAAIEAGHDPAVFPLAMPSIVGPEAILAVIVLTDNHLYSVPMQAATAGMMLLVLGITFLLLRSAGHVLRVLTTSGAAILERIMGMILTALAVELVLTALKIV
jgi:multiple antibiotic resistance protein